MIKIYGFYYTAHLKPQKKELITRMLAKCKAQMMAVQLGGSNLRSYFSLFVDKVHLVM